MVLNFADIARDIRKYSPGVLPESFREHCGRLCGCFPCREPSGLTSAVYSPLPDDIAEAVLIAAMVMDAGLRRWRSWRWDAERKGPTGGFHSHEVFFDSDPGGSIGAAYAAWKWAKGIA